MRADLDPASVIVSFGRVFQITISGNVGITIRCCQFNGPLLNAPTLCSRETYITRK